MPPELQVHHASVRDQQRIRRLIEESRRSFAAFGLEDLPRLLAAGNCIVADYDDTAWAFLCASANHSDWAYLRGVAIKDGWRVDDGLAAVLAPLLEHLRAHAISHLAVYGTALWLAPSLTRAGFERWEWIVSLERHPRPVADAYPPARFGSARWADTTWARSRHSTTPYSSRPISSPAANWWN